MECVDGDINILKTEKSADSGACWDEITKLLNLHISRALYPSLFFDFAIICLIPTFISGFFSSKFWHGNFSHKIKDNLVHLVT